MRRATHHCFPLAALLTLSAGACRGGKDVVLDLAAELPVAERESARDLILFGTPDAEPHQGHGLIRETAPIAGDRFIWARRQADVTMRWADASPRTAILDVAAYPGIAGQTVEVLLNDASVGRLDVGARRRYRLSLPAESQKSGENRLRLAFSQIAPPGNPHGRRLSAALYSLVVGPAGDAALDDLASPDAPPPLSVAEFGGAGDLVQAGPSALRYALRLPEAAELRFTPSLHPAARAANGRARLLVTIEERSGNERELWSRTIGAGDAAPGEVALPIPGAVGATVRLGLHVSGERRAWAVWGAPRVLGSRPLASAASPAPFTQEQQQKADALRGSLKDASVLLIILDAGGAHHFGCYGYQRGTTPEIDRLAAEGVVFERAYTPAVYTLGAMASVWTSLPPDEHHRGASYDDPLPKGPLTLAELLGAHGVLTAGWVANGMAGPAFGLDRGFGEFHEIYRGHSFNADSFGQVLPAWFEAHKDRRFFAYAHFREPHSPYDPPPPFTTRFGPDGPLPKAMRTNMDWIDDVNARRKKLTPEEADHLVRLYDGGLAFADQEIGRLRKALEGAGLWDRTVVIVAADHGEELLEHGFVGHNVPLHEETVHVPLVVRFPRGSGPSGIRVPALVDLLDLSPTIADVFGVLGRGGSDRAFEGRSLLPVVYGAPGKAAVFTRNAKGDKPSYAVRDGRFALIHNTRYGQEELFDTRSDPGEMRELQGVEAVEAAYHRQMLYRWLGSLRRGEEEEGAGAQLTPEQRENLRALGYVH